MQWTLTMRRLIMRSLFTLVALLLAGTIAAFLRGVSMWSVLLVSIVFVGMELTFFLGVFAAYGHFTPRHKRRPPDGETARPQRSISPVPLNVQNPGGSYRDMVFK
jgi:hypothetical protein